VTPRRLDRFEQAVLVGLYGLMVWRMSPPDITEAPLYLLIFMASEATLILFALIRRPTDKISASAGEWAVAFGGTLAVLFVANGSGTWMPGLGTLFMLVGWVIHTGAKLTLRRSFGVVAANRGLKTDGLYAIVRHPMYMGYLITHVGFFLSVPSLWNVAVFTVAWTCMVRRMHTEERVLSSSPEFAAYCAKVRYRLIPGIW
jgi:protein-S-isoprenylcysteine O-methyltransferase Ste14